MHLRTVAVILPFALLAACGGSGGGEEETAAAPDAAETAAPAAPAVEDAAAPAASETASAAAATTPAASAAASEPASEPVAVASAAVAAPAAFAICKTCHAVEPGKNGVGPTLFAIVGSKAGEVPGYAFSPALKSSGITWDRAALDTWLKGPMKMVPGTKMVIAVPDAAKRKQIIDYLETLK